MAIIRAPILIVGGGPVGLSLALFLNYWGVRCTIINTGAKPRASPKGKTNNARTMEIFRQIGIIDDIRNLGFSAHRPNDVCFFTRYSKHEIYRHRMPGMKERLQLRSAAPCTDQYVEPICRTNHMYIEQCLFKKCQQAELVDVRFGYEAIDFSRSSDITMVRAVRLNDGREFDFGAEHVIDCAGGRSLIRKGLGIFYKGDPQNDKAYMAGRFYNVWVRIPNLYSIAPALKTAWMTTTLNADKSTRGLLFPLNDDDEFVLVTKASHLDRELTADDIKDMIRKMAGNDGLAVSVLDHTPWSAAPARVANKYRVGNIFLAGDAAHLFTPVGGFGMNTGIDDAHNLAWKLAAVHQGWSGFKLLDSYELERQPIAFRNTSTSHKASAEWHNPIIDDKLESEDAEGEQARAAAVQQSYIKDMHFCVKEENDFTGNQLGSRYDESPLIISDGTPPPVDTWPETFHTYTPSSVPGGRLPHLWLEDEHVMGASVYDQLSKGFTLIRTNRPRTDDEVTQLLALANERRIPLKVVDITRPEAMGLYERRLLLVRPDQYVAWRGDELPDDCNALLDQVCGFV